MSTPNLTPEQKAQYERSYRIWVREYPKIVEGVLPILAQRERICDVLGARAI
jgi:hypothetical protein